MGISIEILQWQKPLMYGDNFKFGQITDIVDFKISQQFYYIKNSI